MLLEDPVEAPPLAGARRVHRLVEGTEFLGEYQGGGFREPKFLIRRSDGQILWKLGGTPVNVDLTIVCEEPKLFLHKASIGARLQDVLGAQVSVKASTNEGMGAIGRGEGIAVIAVCAVEV